MILLKNGRNMSTKLMALLVVLIMIGETGLASASIQNNTKTPIKHLIILMMENHSFDNLFGVYGKTRSGNIANGVSIPYNLLSHPVTQNLTPVPTGSYSTSNPYEGYYNYHQDWNNGSMNGFLNGSGPSSLSYFGVNQTAIEWALAQNYGIGDMYFSSVLSETLPNRLYSLAGYSPVKQDQLSPPPYVLYNDTIFSELDSYGVSWAYYFLNPSIFRYPLNFIEGIGAKSSHIDSWNDFTNSVMSGSLPSVTWVSPVGGGAANFDQHPPSSILIGEIWLFNIVEMVMKSKIWNSTAIFVTYDEGGGYYDQVSPPSIGSLQLGFRVPFIVISPYAKENYVSNTVLTHTSILAFIDYNWGMPPLNPLVSVSNVPLDFFNFNISYANGDISRPPVQFNTSFGEFIRSSLDFNQNTVYQYNNIGSLFPMRFQFNLSKLPYSLQGSSNFSLSQVSSSYYVKADHPGTSIPPYLIYGMLILGVIVVSAVVFARMRRSGKR